ncbi:MAG: 3-oxoacyl-ACP synthase [Pseudonocardiaceae bacterium]
MPVCLRTIASWFPDDSVPVRTLPETSDLSPRQQKIIHNLGVDEVREAGALTEVDLARNAALAVLERSGTDAAGLDGLILVQGRVPEYLISSEATRLQRAIGADGAMTLGVGELGCVSSSAALSVAAGLFATNPDWQRILLAMGVKTPTAQRYRHPMTVLGDGGLAVLLTRDGPGRFRMLDHVLESDGRYADLFRIRYRDCIAEDWMEECSDLNVYSFHLAMDSRNRFQRLNKRLLDRSGSAGEEPHSHVMQNLSVGAFAFWEEALGTRFLPSCAENLRGYGHVGPVDVLLNLDVAATRIAPGERVLALNSSPVAAWSSALFERLPDSELPDSDLLSGAPPTPDRSDG